jgi:cytoskeletal protein CcmA (bactofilin family)
MELLLLLVLAMLWFSLPFAGALHELYHPTDAAPLRVERLKSANPLGPALVGAGSAERGGPMQLSEALADEHTAVAAGEARAGVLYVDESATWSALLPRVQGGEHAVWLEADLLLDSPVPDHLQVLRARSVRVGPGARVGANVCAAQSVALSPGSVLGCVQAPSIRVESAAAQAGSPAAALVEDTPHTPSAAQKPAAAVARAAGVEGARWHEPQGWWRSAGVARVLPHAQVRGDIVSRKELLVEVGARIEGSLKAQGRVRLGPNACVIGDIVAQHVELAEGARVLGSVVADETVSLAQGARVGASRTLATVLAREVLMREGACVHGAVVVHAGLRAL